MAFEASGTHAQLFVGYHRAADVSAWNLVKREEFVGDSVVVFSGKLERIDHFWTTYTNVSVRVRMSKCWWVWDTAQVQTLEPLLVLMTGSPRAVLL